MRPINTMNLVLRRLRDDWQLMVSIFLGILVATTLMSGAPVYLDSLERQSIVGSIDSAVERLSDSYLTIVAKTDFVPVEDESIRATNAAYMGAVERHIAPIHIGTNRHIQMPFHAVALPSHVTSGNPSQIPGRVDLGFLQSYSDIENHLTFLTGGMTSDVVQRGTQGPMVEAIISDVLAEGFDGLSVEDVVILTPSGSDPVRISVRIVGIFEATDSTEDYWQGDAEPFVNPRRPPNPEGTDIEIEPLVLGMFVTENALVESVGSAFPGAVVDSTWYGAIDKEILKTLSSGEMRRRMDGLSEELDLSLPGSTLFSGIIALLLEFERSSFLASVPLLLLMTVMGVTVLYFLFMIVSYLAPARESDVALFRSRGTSIYHLLRLYLIEGVLLTLVAVAMAPFLALIGVSLVGTLPYFQNITGGSPLPVAINLVPFVTALGAGLLCFVVFVVPGVLGARSGLIVHRLRSSRPPSVPFVQRYYLDLGLLAVGGVLFWELQARGELVSGGLFDQADVNEALLVAPVLFLLVVGLLFFRVFPMFVRYIGGESQALVDAVTTATLGVLIPALAVRDIRADVSTAWIPESVILAGVAAAYFVCSRSDSWKLRVPGLVLQVALIALFIWREPIDPDQSSAVFVTSIALTLIVPMQLLYYLFRGFARRAPVWVSMTLWHMTRNPLQYSWLILLLVLVSGVGILATTVGATLDRSYEERIRYSVGSDVRVTGLPSFYGSGDGGIKNVYGTLDGVESVSLAVRSDGRVGVATTGRNSDI
jgi:putative ABC transport system permease protein